MFISESNMMPHKPHRGTMSYQAIAGRTTIKGKNANLSSFVPLFVVPLLHFSPSFRLSLSGKLGGSSCVFKLRM